LGQRGLAFSLSTFSSTWSRAMIFLALRRASIFHHHILILLNIRASGEMIFTSEKN
jgi:hypothetical protein